MEAVAFKEKPKALSGICSLDNVEECLILQTCNRIEIFVVTEDEGTADLVKTYFVKRAAENVEEAAKAVETSIDRDAFNHLLRVTSGMESMVIGEDQIANQVWNAYLEAEKANAVGPVLSLLFNRAVNVGRRVRRETGINKGAVSVGSAAVELAENLLGSLNEKKILVMGAGETGTLVAKSMSRRCLSPIFIANRTYERALRLADELCGKAVKFDKLNEVLVDADIVFCSTSAPHYLLTNEIVSKLIMTRQNKNDLIVIDISNPRNVEEAIKELPHVKLFNIDDLTSIAERNKQERQKSVNEAFKIVDHEVFVLETAVRADSVREIVSELLSQIETSRQRELAKALNMLGGLDERQRKIVSDLTSILLKQMFLPVVENFRQAAANNETELIDVATKLLEIKC